MFSASWYGRSAYHHLVLVFLLWNQLFKHCTASLWDRMSPVRTDLWGNTSDQIDRSLNVRERLLPQDGNVQQAFPHDSRTNTSASAPWYEASAYLNPDSVALDFVQGVFFVAAASCILWCFYCCGVRLGVCPDPRLDQYRYGRIVREGRGVYSKVSEHFDASQGETTWDEDSHVSVEFGESHLDDPYDEPNLEQEEERLYQDAERFFGDRRRKTPAGQDSHEEDDRIGQIVDLELAERQPTTGSRSMTLSSRKASNQV